MNMDMNGLIAAMTDRRMWTAATDMITIVHQARDNGCDCDVCVQLRAIGGFLDDLHDQFKEGEGDH